jgi:hypothetical protein
MSAHRVLTVLALGLALLAPQAQADGPDRIYVGVTLREAVDGRSPPEQRMEYLVLYPQGLALRQIPFGGLDYDNVAAFAEKHKNLVGSYTRAEDSLQVEWGAGTRKHQTWELQASGSGWTRGRNTTFEVADRVDRQTLKGIWQKVSSVKRSTTGNVVGVSGGEFIFRSNGEFEQGKKQGRFELEGYTLILYDTDGEIRRFAIYRWPWAAGTIAIETNLYQLLQSRR